MPRRISAGTPEETPQEAAARVVERLINKYPLQSPAEALAAMPKDDAQTWLKSLTKEQLAALEYDFRFWARPNQREPNSYKTLLLLAGRGHGKTWTAAQIVRKWIESGERKHVAVVGANAADVRDFMVEEHYTQGSGLMQICPEWNRPHYSPTKKILRWDNPNYKSYGAVCSLRSAEMPSSLRGPGYDGAWVDELCKMQYADEVLHMLRFTLRRGNNPRTVISTTPKPIPALVDLLKRAEESIKDGTNDIVVVKGSTYDNKANLSPEFLKDIQDFEGTSLGRQEIYADVILSADGALWTMGLIDMHRLRSDKVPTFCQIVIGVDPQTGYKPSGDIAHTEQRRTTRSTMTGIIVVGITPFVRGFKQHGYVLADYSVNGTPDIWGKRVIEAYNFWGQDCPCVIVAEQNQGGRMVENILRSLNPSINLLLRTAVSKKHERAIPVVARYEQGLVHHVGVLPLLESELCLYEPGDEDRKFSPNRLDACVWALRHGLVDGKRAGAGIAIQRAI